MSEAKVHYYKLLEKKFEIEEDIFKKLSDLQDLKKKIADQKKKRAKDNKEILSFGLGLDKGVRS